MYPLVGQRLVCFTELDPIKKYFLYVRRQDIFSVSTTHFATGRYAGVPASLQTTLPVTHFSNVQAKVQTKLLGKT